jgi:hypothetical protein
MAQASFPINSIGGIGYKRSSGSGYPPGPPTTFENLQTLGQAPYARRDLLAGVYTVEVIVYQFFVTLDPSARIISATLTCPDDGLGDGATADALQCALEWFTGYDPSGIDDNYREDSSATAATAFAVTAQASITLANVSNIPRNGYANLRLAITQRASDFAPSGQNFAHLRDGTGRLKLNVVYSLTQQPIPIAPIGGAYDRTQPIVFQWKHIDGSNPPLPQAQFMLEGRTSSDGGATWSAWASLGTVTSPNQFYNLPANTFGSPVLVQWRITTYTADGIASPVSNVSQFTAANAVAVPSVTAPSGTITASTVTVTWTSTESGRISWQARIIRISDGAVIADSGEVNGAALTWSPSAVLSDLTAYQAQVRVKSASGVQGAYGTLNFSTAFHPPPTPTLSLTPDAANGRMILNISNPTPGGGQDTATKNYIYRSDDGGATYKMIVGPNGQGLPASWPINTPYYDIMIPSLITCFYKVVAIGSTGSQATSAVASAQVKLAGVWIHDVYDPTSVLHFKGYDFQSAGEGVQTSMTSRSGAMKDTYASDTELVHYEGRALPVALKGEHVDKSYTSKILILKKSEGDSSLLTNLIERQSTYCVRLYQSGHNKYIGAMRTWTREQTIPIDVGSVVEFMIDVTDFKEDLSQ